MTPIRPALTDLATVALSNIRHAVILVGADGLVIFANSDAEAFFSMSSATLGRTRLQDLVPFGSPLMALVDQVRGTMMPVNEYRVDISSPRFGSDLIVDLYVSPCPEIEGVVSVMFQERSMADKMDRQMIHRGAARSVTGLASMLAHEIKNPLSGITGRGAAPGNCRKRQ